MMKEDRVRKREGKRRGWNTRKDRSVGRRAEVGGEKSLDD